jgi:D-3-phosphoglycerate dehydrogenase / 2-oxoglutarate reductase
MSQPSRRVVVTQRFFDDTTIAYLKDHGCEVHITELPPGQADNNVPADTLARWLDGAAGWIVGHAPVTRELLARLPQLQVIARRGVGYDRVDTVAVRDLGRVATIAAGSNDATVADLTIGLMLGVVRRFREGQSGLAGGSWAIPMGGDLSGKTVGLVGYGRIGQAVARRLAGFDAEVLVSAPQPPAVDAAGPAVTHVDLDTLLARSDFVSLHAPLTPQTQRLIRAETLARMKRTAIVINTARGGLVDDRELLAALRAGTIAGAGLDVFMSESDAAYQDVTRDLLNLPIVIGLPHVGASTRECLARMNMVAARCVVAALDGQPMPAGCVVADGR